MPDELDQVEKTEPPANGEKPTDQQRKPFDFEKWLAEQPDEVRAGYDTHTNGLRSALEKERKAAKKRDDEITEAKRKADEAALSELEKATRRLKELETANAELTAKQRTAAAREALRLSASKGKIEFASAQAEADALALALAAVTLSDDGAIENADDVWKAIIKERDYLVKKATQPAGDTSATKRGTSSGPVLTEEERREFAATYGIDPRYLPVNSK